MKLVEQNRKGWNFIFSRKNLSINFETEAKVLQLLNSESFLFGYTELKQSEEIEAKKKEFKLTKKVRSTQKTV